MGGYIIIIVIQAILKFYIHDDILIEYFTGYFITIQFGSGVGFFLFEDFKIS